HFPLLYGRFRRGFLNGGRDDIAQTGAQPLIAAARQNARQLAGAAVIGHLEDGSHPDHDGFLVVPAVGASVLASTSSAEGSTPTCTARRTTSASVHRFS